MELPFITEREEFKHRVCSWCINTDCTDRNLWETLEHSQQIVCLDFVCDPEVQGALP